MRVGVDSYSYHRYFGEIRPGESDPGVRWSTWDVLDRAAELGVDGVSLETCFLPVGDPGLEADLGRRVHELGLDCVLAWGHPTGLEMGNSPTAFADLLAIIAMAGRMSVPLVRLVVGVTVHWQAEPEDRVVERVAPLLQHACDMAAGHGVDLAIETHCDLSVTSSLALIDHVDREGLGIVFDTVNVVRIGEPLEAAAARCAPFVRMLHVKDVRLRDADRADPGGWWPMAPLGEGDLDLGTVLNTMISAGFDGLACVEMATLPAGADEDDMVAAGVSWLRAFDKETAWRR
ncbi:MAG: sugar phosphate isomerase/epimerase [Acidimicrobiia bacterium]|nr:sugar phosphate isomerase/epimerase [Acidimicrobiia bacterium]